ncbi:Transcriptional regulatory protein DegU [uncultured bacterium]|nr:Transcriptional regulatory protein DegU [uncultured bacterium]
MGLRMSVGDNEKIRVLIADDHQIVREGLAVILNEQDDIVVVGLAEDGNEAVVKARELSPDIVLMDISMPKMNGIEATVKIKNENPSVGVIILTMYTEEKYIFDLVRAGAAGYLLKDVDSGQIAKAIKVVANGESILNPSIANKILSEFTKLSKKNEKQGYYKNHDGLTRQELIILNLLSEGRTNKEIAKELGLSEKTIKNHMYKIFKRLNVKDRTRAVIIAMQKGYLNMTKD